MVPTVQVFLASSRQAIQGEGPATVLRRLLTEQLRDSVYIEPWTRAFDLGEAFIESLERAARDSDFAVIVATPDDPLTKGDKQALAPRDNVVFELGLFMSALGRDRCLLVQQDDPKLQLPTDLLGIEPAKFKHTGEKELTKALDYAALRIVQRIRRDGPREKATPATLAARREVGQFARRLEGAWWQRVFRDDKKDTSALSFLQVSFDSIVNAVALDGFAYARSGAPAATWKSEIVGLDHVKRRLLYAWTGRAVQADVANRSFNGFGQMDFHQPADPADLLSRGRGNFWNVDELNPAETIIKPIEVQRITDADMFATMREGTLKDKAALVVKTIEAW